MSANCMLLRLGAVDQVIWFSCIDGQEARVDLRSVLAVVGLSWKKWQPIVTMICAQEGLSLLNANDATGAPTQFLFATEVPFLLEALQEARAGRGHPKARIAAVLKVWNAALIEAAGSRSTAGLFLRSVMGLRGMAGATGPDSLENAPKRAISPMARKSQPSITKQTEREARQLADQKLSLSEIAKRLSISRATASLLVRGKYRFSPLALPQEVGPEVVEHPEAAPETPKPTETPEEAAMLLQNHALSPEARQHFGLLRNPFVDDVQSPADVYQTPSVRYVRAALMDCAQHHGFMAVVGESGAGKSTLAEDLEERIKAEGRDVLIARPYVLAMEASDAKGKTLKSGHIAEAIAYALDPQLKVKSSPEARFRQVHELLKASRKAGRRHLLLIEEAHCLPTATLKHLKRFLELKDGMQRLLGVALIAQPELRERLNSQNPEVREVMQRCELVELSPLDNELEGYLRHKFARFELAFDQVFDAAAIDAIRTRLVHVPRGGRAQDARSICYPLVVNNLVIRALNAAARAGWPRVDAHVIAGC